MPVKSIEKQILDRGVLGNMPRFGKLRKGGEKPAGKIGPDLDHFRLTLEPEYEYIRDEFERLFTTEPIVLRNVMIAADSPDKALDYWYEEWAHAKLVRRCDEETVVAHWNEGDGRYSNQPYACTCNPMDRACSLTGRLNIVIPALCEAVGTWGILTILTGSIYDVTALRASMHVAGAFMQKIQNVSFWSVPFEIGRVTRKVPVTINGKRSIKPMSLLYAQVEPDFNQKVLSPMLTAPAQLLLAGVNPETGEIPEVVIEQAASWDRDLVNAQTIHLFDHENHQMNAIDKMIADGIITDVMEDDEVIDTVISNREQRKTEKQNQKPRKNGSKSNQKAEKPSESPAQDDNPYAWANDAQRVAKLINASKLNMGQVIRALQWATGDYKGETVTDFHITAADAWAACICQYYNFDAGLILEAVGGDPQNTVYKNAMLLMQAKDIPF